MTAAAGAPDRGPADNRLREPLGAVFERVPAAWQAVTRPFLASAAGQALARFVDARVDAGVPVYPAAVFRALELTPPQAVRVVILGQDPYHGPGQAQGLAFSVPPGQRLPPSLRNIVQEVARDTGAAPRCGGDLRAWARQGVLLLNTVLTVEAGRPHSHARRGWEGLTDALLRHVASQGPPVLFLLWGGAAQARRALVEHAAQAVLCANHPSPLSARRAPQPFVGCAHFSQVNAWLARWRPGTPAIVW